MNVTNDFKKVSYLFPLELLLRQLLTNPGNDRPKCQQCFVPAENQGFKMSFHLCLSKLDAPS